MKKLSIILVLITIIIGTSFGQVKKSEANRSILIGRAKMLGRTLTELSYRISGVDTLCQLFYKDYTNEQLDEWKSVFFPGGSKIIDDLYKEFKTDISADYGKQSNFNLGDNKVLVITSKVMGAKYLLITFTSKSGITSIMKLTDSQLDTLFNIEDQ